MINQFSRTELLFGKEKMKNIYNSKVAVFGIGGVGGHCVLALARSGVGQLDLIDNDTVSITNINRQAVANHSTIGESKVEVARQMILDINPNAVVNVYNTFFLPENSSDFDFSKYDYVVDAIDTVSGKLALVEKAKREGCKIISSMGAGNKLDPTAFEVVDIYSTSVCPLARVMRTELKKRGVNSLKVVYSKEKALKPLDSEENTTKRQVPGSTAFVPSVVGLIIAGEVIKDLAVKE